VKCHYKTTDAQYAQENEINTWKKCTKENYCHQSFIKIPHMNNDFDYLNYCHHYSICFTLDLQTTVLQNLYKHFNKTSFTNSKIYLAFINKMLHNFQIVFSNIFTHQPLEKYIFLLLHLSSLAKISSSLICIIIALISCRCVLFMTCFNIYLFMLLFCRCHWS
jgi:hypothetical protein